VTISCCVSYLAYVRLCIHNVNSKNLLDIRDGILTPNTNSIRCNNAVLLCPCHKFRTAQEDSQTANTTAGNYRVFPQSSVARHEVGIAR